MGHTGTAKGKGKAGKVPTCTLKLVALAEMSATKPPSGMLVATFQKIKDTVFLKGRGSTNFKPYETP
jgi:hypothetical protein